MNKINSNLSPSKLSPFKKYKPSVSPFKKYTSTTPKNENDQRNPISPSKYINTSANPEMSHLAESAHTLGSNRNEDYQQPFQQNKEDFLNSLKARNKLNRRLTCHSNIGQTEKNENNTLQEQKCSGVEKKSIQQLSPDPLKGSHTQAVKSGKKLKTENFATIKAKLEAKYSFGQNNANAKNSNHIQENDEEEQFTRIRDRKLSHQVLGPNYYRNSAVKVDGAENVCFTPNLGRRQSDMLPSFTKKPLKEQNDKWDPLQFLSPKNMTDSRRVPHKQSVNLVKEPKLRKNSEGVNGSSHAVMPSFLFKKSKKPQQEDERPLLMCSDKGQKPIPTSPDKTALKITEKQKSKSLLKPKLQTKQLLGPNSRGKKLSLKNFTILRQLGEGKFGKVLLVQQKQTKFICAMKIFKKSQIKQDDFIDQFTRQMKLQLYMNHPNVIKMYGYFDDLSNIYILIEVACDGTLSSFIQHRQDVANNGNLSKIAKFSASNNLQSSKKLPSIPPSMSEAASDVITKCGLSYRQIAIVMYQLCSAINYLHSRNIIHRDLKPQNIVIHEKTIKLCDFGWSVFKGTTLRNTFCGTPLYLCPQLIVGEDYDEKVDIWAIGIMLYELVIGANPFKIKKQEDLANIVYESIDIEAHTTTDQKKFARSEENKNSKEKNAVDSHVRDLILGCLNKDPRERLDIKDILDHPYFRQSCPELVPKTYPRTRASTTATVDSDSLQ